MASGENGAPGSIPDQLWRLSTLQRDTVKKLEKIEEKLEKLEREQWRVDNIDNRVGMIHNRLDAIEKKLTNGRNSLLGESSLVRTIFFGLLILVGALATGTWLSTVGLFK